VRGSCAAKSVPAKCFLMPDMWMFVLVLLFAVLNCARCEAAATYLVCVCVCVFNTCWCLYVCVCLTCAEI
jgi:hypothetical protein